MKTVEGKPNNPELPADTVDSVLLLKTYHEVAEPVALLRNLRASLRPGRASASSIATAMVRTTASIRKLSFTRPSEAGYRLLEEHDDLVKGDKMDYFLVFGVEVERCRVQVERAFQARVRPRRKIRVP